MLEPGPVLRSTQSTMAASRSAVTLGRMMSGCKWSQARINKPWIHSPANQKPILYIFGRYSKTTGNGLLVQTPCAGLLTWHVINLTTPAWTLIRGDTSLLPWFLSCLHWIQLKAISKRIRTKWYPEIGWAHSQVLPFEHIRQPLPTHPKTFRLHHQS